MKDDSGTFCCNIGEIKLSWTNKKVKRKKLLKINGRHFLFTVNGEEKEMDPPRKSI